MPILRTRLCLHKDITAGTKDETQTYTPSGEFRLVRASINAAYDLNCVVNIDFDGEILFHGKGGETLMSPITRTGDGIKVVKLILDAADLPTGSVILGGDVHFEEEI